MRLPQRECGGQRTTSLDSVSPFHVLFEAVSLLLLQLLPCPRKLPGNSPVSRLTEGIPDMSPHPWLFTWGFEYRVQVLKLAGHRVTNLSSPRPPH